MLRVISGLTDGLGLILKRKKLRRAPPEAEAMEGDSDNFRLATKDCLNRSLRL